MNFNLEIDYLEAEKLVVAVMKESLEILEESVALNDTGIKIMHREDLESAEQKWIPALITLIEYFGGSVMTTEAAEKQYEAEHVRHYAGRKLAIYNPDNLPVEELPIIFGFNNGGEPGWMNGVLLAEDGTHLGGHICSSEAYMPADLGVLEGTRPDRHEKFQAHYPKGYRMEFVSFDDVMDTPKLVRAAHIYKENNHE